MSETIVETTCYDRKLCDDRGCSLWPSISNIMFGFYCLFWFCQFSQQVLLRSLVFFLVYSTIKLSPDPMSPRKVHLSLMPFPASAWTYIVKSRISRICSWNKFWRPSFSKNMHQCSHCQLPVSQSQMFLNFCLFCMPFCFIILCITIDVRTINWLSIYPYCQLWLCYLAHYFTDNAFLKPIMVVCLFKELPFLDFQSPTMTCRSGLVIHHTRNVNIIE